MIEQNSNLGKLESVHGLSPAYLQQALVVIILSFIFFLAMLFAFSLRQQIGYFILATAFLIIKLFMLFGWMRQRKKELRLYENGFTYQKKTCKINEIEKIYVKHLNRMFGGEKIEWTITKTNGEKIVLTEAIYKVAGIIEKIDQKLALREVEEVVEKI